MRVQNNTVKMTYAQAGDMIQHCNVAASVVAQTVDEKDDIAVWKMACAINAKELRKLCGRIEHKIRSENMQLVASERWQAVCEKLKELTQHTIGSEIDWTAFALYCLDEHGIYVLPGKDQVRDAIVENMTPSDSISCEQAMAMAVTRVHDEWRRDPAMLEVCELVAAEIEEAHFQMNQKLWELQIAQVTFKQVPAGLSGGYMLALFWMINLTGNVASGLAGLARQCEQVDTLDDDCEVCQNDHTKVGDDCGENDLSAE